MRQLLPGLLCLLSLSAGADIPGLDGGHIKGRWLTSTYPDDSLFRDALGAVAHDQGADLRAKFSARRERLGLRADYTLVGQFGDSVAVGEILGDALFLPPTVPDDEFRWWDLTHDISDGKHHAVVQRLDRLYVDYSGDKLVGRFGRQAVSWGNGLIYNPVDFFNPFSPAAVDTEYKLGDDMLYAQYLRDSGDDWQLVHVVRRDIDGDVSSDVASTALKYHGFGVEREFDLVVAEHWLKP